jgi:trigger factor
VVELKPDFELQDYAGLAIETLPVTTTDQEVEDTIRDVLRQQARPEPAGDEGLTENGLALARLSFHHTGEDGTSREVVARDGLRISPATPPIGVDPEQFRSAVTGAVEGAERELPLTFPDGFETAELRGQAGVCKVQLTQVFKLVPPEESELYRQFGVDDGPALRTRVREQLLAHKQRQEEQRLEAELFDRVIDSHPMPVPQRMLANQVAAREARAVQDLIEQQGLSKEAAQAQVESEADSTRSASEKSLRALFLVEAIGDAERLQVTREDLSAELRQIAARNRTAVDEVVKYYQQHNLVQQLTVELLERKVRAALRSKAAITPKA